jgi:hypothetical protein
VPERGRGWGRSCREHLASPAALRRCLLIALVVGSVLTMINQGDLLLDGRLPAALGFKIPLNFLVPFVVSSLGYIAARRAAGTAGMETGPKRRPAPFR